MKKKTLWTLTSLLMILVICIFLFPAVILHFGKMYSGEIFGFEEGEEEHYQIKPSENWKLNLYVVTNHNEDMYQEPVSIMKLIFLKDKPPSTVDYSILHTDTSGTIHIKDKHYILKIEQSQSLIELAKEQSPKGSVKIKLAWGNQEEVVDLPFMSSFGHRQFPWYLGFLEREF